MARTGTAGRPRSDTARIAVLQAVDDLLVDVGYAAMTMKGIAERAGVGRQTVYRWWSTKAEILLEACVDDAQEELVSVARADPSADLRDYLKVLSRFLTVSPAGLAYRALLGEAQHDAAVRDLVRRSDPLSAPTEAVLSRNDSAFPAMPDPRLAGAQLIGPLLAQLFTTGEPFSAAALKTHVATLVRAWS